MEIDTSHQSGNAAGWAALHGFDETVDGSDWAKTAHPDMITAAAHLGYDLTDHHPTQVDKALIAWADLVLAMDHSVLDQLRPIAGPGSEQKLRLYLDDGSDVPDPMGKGPREFATSAAIIEAGATPYLP